MFYRASLLSAESPHRLSFVEDGVIGVDDTGTLTEVGTFQEASARHPHMPITDLRPFWILPGLVDLHTHIPQLPAAALGGLGLLPWLETHIYPAEARFADPHAAVQTAQAFFQEMLSWGTTTVAAYGTVHPEAVDAIFHLADRLGVRMLLGTVLMDRHIPQSLQLPMDLALAQAEELCQAWHGRRHGRLMYAFAPRFAPVCSPELMRRTASLAEKYGAYIQTHIGEQAAEIAWVRALFPDAAHYADVYRRAGLLGPRTLLGHGVHLLREERAMLHDAGATVVHCPRANAFLGSGMMPLRQYLSEGLSVGLGTDVGAGASVNMWAEMAMACQVSHLRQGQGDHGDALSIAEVFWLATQGGADALGLGRVVGGLEPGREADFLVVDPRLAAPMGQVETPAVPEHVLSRMIHRPHPGMIQQVFVRGRACMPQAS